MFPEYKNLEQHYILHICQSLQHILSGSQFSVWTQNLIQYSSRVVQYSSQYKIVCEPLSIKNAYNAIRARSLVNITLLSETL